MKLFCIFKEQNIFDVIVYGSLGDISQSIEWQDILDDYFIIIDSEGNIYKWDDSKKEEYATVYNYTLKIDGIDTELSRICILNYELNGYASEFKFKL